MAAALLRAGFDLAFENEDDRSTSHVEFTATYKETQRKFSVEAKHRESENLRFGRKLARALAKAATYERIVFIDLNSRPHEDLTVVAKHALRGIEHMEKLPDLPRAYIVLTNTPVTADLDASPSALGLLTTFKIPELKLGKVWHSLREAVDVRDRHWEVYAIGQSMRDHWEIPVTFDGEIPEFAFGGSDRPRLLIGNKYVVKDARGEDVQATLDTATVDEQKELAYCGVFLPDGSAQVVTWPLTKLEMSAWRRHPDTFFGQVGQRKTRADSPMELYDFMFNSYRDTPKARLLEFLADAADIESLRTKSQVDLAREYAIRCTEGVVAQAGESAPKPSGPEHDLLQKILSP